MAAPKGNEYYKMREKDGRELIFEKAEDFRDKAYEYIEWCKKNPLSKREAIKSGNRAGEIIDIKIDRPYTIEGLCVYAGISIKTFYNYEEREDFVQVVTHIREIIRQNQLEGAMVDNYNPNIVARLLGLAEKKTVDIPNGLSITVTSKDTKKDIEALKDNLQTE